MISRKKLCSLLLIQHRLLQKEHIQRARNLKIIKYLSNIATVTVLKYSIEIILHVKIEQTSILIRSVNLEMEDDPLTTGDK